MVVNQSTLPKFAPKTGRVPLMALPAAVVYELDSPKGPQVGVPGATWLTWLKLRHSPGLPGLASTSKQMVRLTTHVTRRHYGVLSELALDG